MNARRYLELLTLSALFLTPGIALAQTPDCKTLHWVTQDGKQVNAAHIFCGEINKKGNPTGFHSMALYASASKNKIRSVKKSRDLGNGLYDAKVTFTNGSQKSSTFYPDACSYEQILKSIAYAAAHPTRSPPTATSATSIASPSSPAVSGSPTSTTTRLPAVTWLSMTSNASWSRGAATSPPRCGQS